jgi:D-alanyl-D-alanine carboxypeptidase
MFAQTMLRSLRAAACLSAALVPALACAQAAPAPAASPVEAIDAYVTKTLAARGFPGASVAVIQDGKVVLAKGYGLADTQKSVPATEQTIHQLASVTKPFTAMATLLLVDEGKIALDGKIADILPGLPAAWAPVTVRHLLTHTSGIKSYTDVFGEQKMPDGKVLTATEILALVKDVPLAFTPGDRMAYCNTGYYLLGMIIEKASGKKYDAFLAERIFKPLAMTSTALDTYGDARPQRARGHSLADGKTKVAEQTHPSQPFAAGALVSNVIDLAKFDAALDARKFLKPATYDAMWTAAKLNGGTSSNYGFGWQVDTYRTRPRVSHGGGITGFSTYFARYPEDKVTVIALVNQDGAGGGLLANGIAEIVIPAIKANAPKPIEDKDPELTAFLRKVLTAAAGGSVETEWLTPQFAGFLLPDRVKQGPQMMGRHGELTAFELMEDTQRDDVRVRVYRATFGTTPLRVQFGVSADRKVGGLGVAPAQ